MGRSPAAPRVFSKAVRLALTLLVLGVLANDHYLTMSLNDLALFAYFFDGRLNFHLFNTFPFRNITSFSK